MLPGIRDRGGLRGGSSDPEAQKKQALTREEEDRQWREKSEAFRTFYEKKGLGGRGWKFTHRPLHLDPEEEKELERTASISHGDEPLLGKPRPGFYEVEKDGKEAPFGLYLDEKGGVKLLNARSSPTGKYRYVPMGDKFDSEGWGSAMDFLAGRMGYDNLVLTVVGDSSPRQAQRELAGMLELAAQRAERGITVEFSKQTENFLQKLTVQERKDFFDRRDQINIRARLARWEMGSKDAMGLDKSKTEVEAQFDKHQLSGDTPDAKKAALREEMELEDSLSDDDKIKLFDAEVKKLNERTEGVKKAGAGLQALREHEDALIRTPPPVMVTAHNRKGVLDPKETHHEAKWLFRSGVAKGRSISQKPVSQEEALQRLEEMFTKPEENGQAERDKLRGAMKKEVVQIEERIGLLKEMAEKAKNDSVAKHDVVIQTKKDELVELRTQLAALNRASPSDPGRIERKTRDVEALETRVQALEVDRAKIVKKIEEKYKPTLEKLDSMKAEKTAALGKLNESERWEKTDRQAAVKQKLDVLRADNPQLTR